MFILGWKYILVLLTPSYAEVREGGRWEGRKMGREEDGYLPPNSMFTAVLEPIYCVRLTRNYIVRVYFRWKN